MSTTFQSKFSKSSFVFQSLKSHQHFPSERDLSLPWANDISWPFEEPSSPTCDLTSPGEPCSVTFPQIALDPSTPVPSSSYLDFFFSSLPIPHHQSLWFELVWMLSHLHIRSPAISMGDAFSIFQIQESTYRLQNWAPNPGAVVTVCQAVGNLSRNKNSVKKSRSPHWKGKFRKLL